MFSKKTFKVKELLDQLALKYNDPNFITLDPISIPHQYTNLQDIEITGFWTAMLAWGQRKTIINKANELFELMDNAPYDFILNHEEKDRTKFEHFKHRTFQYTDTLHFLDFFQSYYKNNLSLEHAFSKHLNPTNPSIKDALIGFNEIFFQSEYSPHRTRKHVSSPQKGSACKRLNMFLRWMVRKDDEGVDFGIWKEISPSTLMIPLDVHVDRVARELGLLQRKNKDWKAVEELSENCKKMNPKDPAIYDFALFSLGVLKK